MPVPPESHPTREATPAPIRLEFDQGSLVIGGLSESLAAEIPDLIYDSRVGRHRLRAHAYASLCMALRRRKLAYEDRARAYEVLELQQTLSSPPRDYQAEAIAAWRQAQRRGCVILPTGAGKSLVATMAMADSQRSTLVVVPTIDLLNQWYDLLAATFDAEIGLLGGGHYEPRAITVTTYDSAYLHMERLGAKFGLAIFDECHHLPSPTYAEAARMAIAPFRLGLSATPERADGRDALLQDLIGPIVFRRDIREMAGEFLAEYRTEPLSISLTRAERAEYEAARATYRNFVQARGIRMSTPRGWKQFLIEASRSEEGRQAMAGWRRQKAIVRGAEAKLKTLRAKLSEHRGERVLIFTEDNATVYAISRQFLIPAVTHKTKAKERRDILLGFNEGRYKALVTSKVLNEGVNIPEANVALVLSGSGSVREHVQRLGRILRPREGKRAVLYELIAQDTSEEFTSQRRRQHTAYGALMDLC